MGFDPPSSATPDAVLTVAAGDASIAVGGTPSDPTLEAGPLSTIAALHPPAAAWSNNGQRITGLADGVAATDAATVEQVTGGTVPIGPAGGVLAGTYPDPAFAAAAFGSSGAVACVGNDSRLSDSRAPSGPAAGNVLEGTYPNPGLAAAVAGAGLAETLDVLSVNVDGTTLEIAADTLRVKALGIAAAQIALATITDAQVAAANKDGAAGTASMRTLGTGGAQAVAGNDSRLSDSRAPNGAAGGNVLEGSYPNPGLAAAVAGAGLAETLDVLSVNVDGSTLEISADSLRVKDLGITNAKVAAATLTDAKVAAANKDGAAGTASMRTLGTGGAQAAAGDDARFSDARTPSGAAGGSLGGTFPNPTLNAGIVGGVYWTTVTKAIDESISSTSTLQDDDELFFTAVNGAVYEFEAVIAYGSPAGGGTPDIIIAFGEDATGRGTYHCIGLSTTDTAQQTALLTTNNAGTSRGTNAANRAMVCHGTFTGNGGTFRFRWAQNSSGVNATIVRAGSVLRYRRIL